MPRSNSFTLWFRVKDVSIYWHLWRSATLTASEKIKNNKSAPYIKVCTGWEWIIIGCLIRIERYNRRKGDWKIKVSLQKQKLKIVNNYHTQYTRWELIWQQKRWWILIYHLSILCGIESCPICSPQEIWAHLPDGFFVCSARTFWRTGRMLCQTLRTSQHRRLLRHLLLSKMERLFFSNFILLNNRNCTDD